MVQRRGGAGLKQKPVQGILIAGELRRQELQRHTASQIEILRFVNNPHPAAAELAGDAVMRDGLANHDKYPGEFILGGIANAVKRENSDRLPVELRYFAGHGTLATGHIT